MQDINPFTAQYLVPPADRISFHGSRANALIDYIISLRKSFVPGRRLDLGIPHRHVDAAAFWKAEFEKSEKEKIKLKNEVFILEHERVKPTSTSTEIDLKYTGKKRKAKGPISNVRAKKQKVEVKEEHERKNIIIDQLEVDLSSSRCLYGRVFGHFLQLNRVDSFKGTVLLRTSYLLKHSAITTLPESSSKVDLVTEFVTAACHLIHGIEVPSDSAKEVVEQPSTKVSLPENGQADQMSKTPQYDTASKLEPLARLFRLLVQNLHGDKSANKITKHEASNIIPAIFSLLKYLIEHVLFLAHTSGARSLHSSATASSKVFRRANGRFALRSAEQALAETPEVPSTPTSPMRSNAREPNILALANLVIHLLSSISSRTDEPDLGLRWSHITESVFKLLISRIASLLSLTVFGASAPIQLFAAPVQLPLLHGDDHERKAREHEAIWLLYLLEGVMPLIPSHTEPARTRARDKNDTCPPPHANEKANQKGAAASAKKILQDTLLRALFGSEAPECEDAFKMRVDLATPLDLPLPPLTSDEGTGTLAGRDSLDDWFKGQMWRIVGWRLLGGGN